MTYTVAGTTITRFEDINQLSTDEILAAYNEATGKNTKRFAKRATGMKQLWSVIADKIEAVEVAPVAQEQVESVEKPAASTSKAAATVAAPSSAEEAPTPTKAAGLKTQVGTLVEALSSGPRSVADITQALGLANEKRARSLIDTARRLGHSIACVGRGTFALVDSAGE